MSLISTLTDFVCALSLTLFILVVTYVTSFCFTPSTLNADNLNETNRKNITIRFIFYYSCNAIVLVTGTYHALLCFTYPTPPSILCRNPTNLSPKLFTWNFHSILCIALILVSGQILLLCFNKLGTTSNFQLIEPKKLITSGIYSWLQHPAYTADFVIILTNGALIQRRDGVAACLLQKNIVDGEKLEIIFQIGYFLTVFAVCWTLAERVRNEEAMLKRAFGIKWEEYHRHTKRFLPGVV
ncbi:uncharacterized protein RCO7_11222 [Rhynchosporium graminicola]|uniref:Protein-S-isoprenylcysteine O-methyltransferase n=1 Tax=Rhynchosporium graminicola TaxID=2792576 RepID=A0A1E1LAX9_9HELO|nr:uncharacterized protein RCO7_11222 [Rhynchosporium commune]